MTLKWERDWEKIVGFLFVLPSLIAVTIFVYGFIGWSGWVSVSNWKRGALPDYSYSGFDSYARLFGTNELYASGIDAKRFRAGLRNVVWFTLLFISACVILGFILAALLDRQIKGEGFFRSLFLFPMALSFIVTGLAWRWLFTPGDPNIGKTGINLVFDTIGLGFIDPNWGSDTIYFSQSWGLSLGVITLVVAAMWQLSGYTMALYLAGLRGISNDLREAARVDGASEMQIYRYIIIPLLKPVTLSVIVVLAHISLKTYDLVVAMGGEGEGFVKDVPALNMWDTTFGQARFSQGAAIGVVLLILTSFLIIPYLNYSIRSEEEQ
ncbi:sugar ABC transporter permease [Anaerolineales bacterium HSG6]|nr:sugar ABC transporter permease [Anaerolineales bacterium HSG6]MDM8531082.1 sugar ABC transporter permease [Anaerolineales bacterium HSG25]